MFHFLVASLHRQLVVWNHDVDEGQPGRLRVLEELDIGRHVDLDRGAREMGHLRGIRGRRVIVPLLEHVLHRLDLLTLRRDDVLEKRSKLDTLDLREHLLRHRHRALVVWDHHLEKLLVELVDASLLPIVRLCFGHVFLRGR